MVEIAECFALEDRTIFQAMLFFDRFTASNNRVSSLISSILFRATIQFNMHVSHQKSGRIMLTVIPKADSEH